MKVMQSSEQGVLCEVQGLWMLLSEQGRGMHLSEHAVMLRAQGQRMQLSGQGVLCEVPGWWESR